jgi:hypothetical protein
MFFCLANSLTVKQYSDASCTNLVATMPITLGSCIDSSSGLSQSSMRYRVCNQTNVIVDRFTNNNCAGSMFYLSSSPNVCQNQMVVTCDDPVPPPPSNPSPNSNDWLVTVKSYSDNYCRTLANTMTATVGSCKVFQAGRSSGKFLFCNSSTVSGNMYANDNCNGNAVMALTSPVNQCYNREFVTCVKLTSSGNSVLILSSYLVALNLLYSLFL